ncbi:MAG: methionine--tRNA ligase [Pseudomonadota bacterium]
MACTCPNCKAPDQSGDNCEVCGASYSPRDLIDPVSVVSGTPPVERQSEHFFFRLENFEAFLRDWIDAGHVHTAVARKLGEWFENGLRDWDISRDKPYFGFEIPGEKDKFFYVWLDAPVGYMASFANLCASRDDLDFDDWWRADSGTELHHFIGKDIMYFHSLFWPAVLKGAGYRQPTAVHAHGFVQINGEKMSKSRGTFIRASSYLAHLEPQYLRYYYAAKLGPGTDDLDLNLDDFVARVNADVVGKLVNIASRCAGFITRLFDGRLAGSLADAALQAEFVDAAGEIAEGYEQREFARAMRRIMALADSANQYIDGKKPWLMQKDPAQHEDVQAVCTQGINLFRLLMIYLKPVLPAVAEAVETFLNVPPLAWGDLDRPLLGHTINRYEPLVTRVDPKKLKAMLAAEAPPEAERNNAAAPAKAKAGAKDEAPGEIDIAAFQNVDLRVARIERAEHVEGADKLLRLTLDVGDGTRQVFAGVKAAYAPEQLEGQLTVVVANLKPRKMRFGLSEGMVLAAGPGGSDIFLVRPDQGAQPGMRVK